MFVCLCAACSAAATCSLSQGFGAGDIIMSCVGTALTGLAFVIYKHRASISVPAVAGTALLSSVFSVMATLGASNLLGVTAGARHEG
jgi:hypothetical protein